MAGTRISKRPIVPDRVRRIQGSFAFLPHRFLREGFLASLTKDELAVYVFLVLAADREGLSFYPYDRICGALELSLDAYVDARNGLLAKDLIAFDGVRFQVLSLPERARDVERDPLRTADDLEAHDPATIRKAVVDALREPRER